MTTPTIQAQLEAAARICGFDIESIGHNCAWCFKPDAQLNEDGERPIFNFRPLTSAEDREALAQKMDAVINHKYKYVYVDPPDKDVIAVYWGDFRTLGVACIFEPDYPSALLMLAYLIDKENGK